MWPFNKNEIKENSKIENIMPVYIGEQFKSEVGLNTIQFPKELGEAHPFDFKLCEETYIHVGLIKGIVDKLVDFIVGGGYYIKSDDPRAITILNTFIEDSDFNSKLRSWLKEALVKGSGFMELGGKGKGIPELKVVNANSMYVLRDKGGNIIKFNQYTGDLTGNKFNEKKIIDFDLNQIAFLPLDTIGDGAYGNGIVFSVLKILDYMAKHQKDEHELVSKKANSPYIINVGSEEKPAKQADLEAIGKKLEHLNNRHEWVFGHNVQVKALDFGNIAEKFSVIREQDIQEVLYSMQVPEVLMGKGNIAEGLADIQMEALQKRAQSYQDEIEKVIEKQVFKRVLLANGIGSKIEMEWGQPSRKERDEEILRITELLKIPYLNPRLSEQLQLKLAEDLNIDKKLLETPKEEKKKELEEPQPKVPEQNEEKQCHHVKENIDKDYDLKEWLGFNYIDYLNAILSTINKGFPNLKADNANQILAGYYSEKEIEKLKEIFSDGFNKGASIKSISKKINNELGKDLFKLNENDELELKDGKPIKILDKEIRSEIIARTETTRLANQGAKEVYKERGFKQVRWISAISERTCAECEAMNGRIFDIENTPDIPLHSMCRCTIAPVTELG